MPGTFVAALAGAVTLGAGYLLGFATTANDRQGLRWQIRQQANEIAHLREHAEHGPDQAAAAERAHALRQVHQHIDELKLHVDNATQYAEEQGNVAITIREVLRPLAERERLWLGLVRLRADARDRRDLATLMDKIAELGSFSTVLLTNEEGLPLASNHEANDLDGTTRIATRLTVLVDQIAGQPGQAPLGIVVRTSDDHSVLCRFFTSQGQRLALTAVSSDPRLNATALEPAVNRVEAALKPVPLPS